MIYHIIAFSIGFILDILIGDPFGKYHPVCAIGKLISMLDGLLNNNNKSKNVQRARGLLLVIIVLLLSTALPAAILYLVYSTSAWFGIAIESIMTYQLLATKSLFDESKKVEEALLNGTIDDARYAVSMIVGRDTKSLSKEGIIKATIETIAENTSDGIIAPMIYLAIGGPILGFFYKTVNTMDSMIGYKNERYKYFGTIAARLDDVLNFIPSRVSALLMIVATLFLDDSYSTKGAITVFVRDRYNHKSPNSAQSEAVVAGALGVLLAGGATYFGEWVEKPTIGDDINPVKIADISRAHALMFLSSFICFLICVCIMNFLILP